MKKLFVIGALAAPVILAACGALNAEFTFGKDEGIPPMKDTKTFDVPQDFACGNDIPIGNDYKVTTKVDGANCVFTFHQDVTAIKAEDYNGPNGATLKGAKAVKRIEIDVTKFELDDATGANPVKLDIGEKLVDLKLSAFGQELFNKDQLVKMQADGHALVTISGSALDQVKAQVTAQKPVVIPVDAIAILPITPKPPAKMSITYEGQPDLVMSAGG